MQIWPPAGDFFPLASQRALGGCCLPVAYPSGKQNSPDAPPELPPGREIRPLLLQLSHGEISPLWGWEILPGHAPARGDMAGVGDQEGRPDPGAL